MIIAIQRNCPAGAEPRDRARPALRVDALWAVTACPAALATAGETVACTGASSTASSFLFSAAFAGGTLGLTSTKFNGAGVSGTLSSGAFGFGGGAATGNLYGSPP